MNKTKTAMITVCGRPNVGKSSLTNALVGEKIAIVSNKPQTTRNRIYGVVNRGDTQYVLLDTPGFHKARNRLGDYMVKVTRESIADVDAVLLLVEPVAHVGIPEAELIEKIKASHLPAILCINKIDTVEKKDDLLAVIAAYSEAYAFDAIIPISARTHEGLDDLMNEIADSKEDVHEMSIYNKVQKAVYNRMHGDIEDYDRRMNSILSALKDQFRNQIG